MELKDKLILQIIIFGNKHRFMLMALILINIERMIFEIVSIACTRQGFTLTNR